MSSCWLTSGRHSISSLPKPFSVRSLWQRCESAIDDLSDEYSTPHGPRKLTEAGMASLLRPFRPPIRSTTIWAPGRKRNDTTGSGKGYHRSQFATAWARYCPEQGGEFGVGQGRLSRQTLMCVGVSDGSKRWGTHR